MPQRKGLLAPQNTFLDTIATRFDGTHSNFVLGNAEAKGYPIVYCSDGFLLLTKYSRANIMSRDSECRFLWGSDTTEEEREKITDAFQMRKELKTEVVFYKRNGEKFLCLLDVIPIKNENGKVVLFLVSHKDLTPNKDCGKDSVNGIATGGEDSYSRSDFSAEFSTEGLDTNENDDPEQMMQSSSVKYQRRRSRAVLYHLQGQYNGKRKNKKLNRFHQNFNTHVADNIPEYKVDDMKRECFIFQHYGPLKIIWDWVILAATFYVAIMVPYHAAVNMHHSHDKDSSFMDIIVEILFMTDVLFNFRTTYVSKSGQIVYDSKKIAYNYFSSWFLIDVIAACPFDLIRLLWSTFNKTIYSNHKIQLMKLTRMARLARLMQKIDRYYQYSALVLTLLIAMFALCAHWMACIWYYIGSMELAQNSTRQIGWMFELSEKINSPYTSNFTGGPAVSNYFITALYFTCSSLTSVGFGNVSANTDSEKLFSICVMMIGALMHAAIFGNVTALIQRMYSRRTAYQSRHRDLKEFIRTHRIPKKLKRRMLEFFQTTWALSHGIDANDVLKDFSDGLRGDIAIHLNRELLGLKIFEKASPGCLKSLAQRIKIAYYTPGEMVMHSGNILQFIYFVCSGSCEILENGEVVALLGKNDWFGTYVDQIPPISIVSSRCDVKALTYCELQCIELTGLYGVFALYPDFREVFSKYLFQDLSFDIQNGAAPRKNLEDNVLANSTNQITTISRLPSISENDDEDYTENDDEEDEENDDDDDNDEDEDDSSQEHSKITCTYCKGDINCHHHPHHHNNQDPYYYSNQSDQYTDSNNPGSNSSKQNHKKKKKKSRNNHNNNNDNNYFNELNDDENDDNVCLIQQATHSDHLMSVLMKNNEKERSKQPSQMTNQNFSALTPDYQLANHQSVNQSDLNNSTKIVITNQNAESNKICPTDSDNKENVRNRRHSFEESQKIVTIINSGLLKQNIETEIQSISIKTPSLRSYSISSTNSTRSKNCRTNACNNKNNKNPNKPNKQSSHKNSNKPPTTIHNEIVDLKSHINRLDNTIAQLEVNFSSMKQDILSVLMKYLKNNANTNQAYVSVDIEEEIQSPNHQYYGDNIPVLNVVSPSPIHESQPHLFNYLTNQSNHTPPSNSKFNQSLDSINNPTCSSTNQNLTSQNFDQSNFVTPTTNSKLSPRSVSSGFVSNHDEEHEDDHHITNTTTTISKALHTQSNTSTNFYRHMSRMQSLPEQNTPLPIRPTTYQQLQQHSQHIDPYTNNTQIKIQHNQQIYANKQLYNNLTPNHTNNTIEYNNIQHANEKECNNDQNSNYVNNVSVFDKCYVRRRVSSPIPFIRSTNL